MNNRIVFRVSAESALDLDSFVDDDLPKVLEFLNCPECYSGWECGFLLETESTPLPRMPEIEVNLSSARPHPIFNEALTNALKGQSSGFSGYIAPEVANDVELLRSHLKENIDKKQWRHALEERGGVNFISGELLSSSGTVAGGGSIL